MENHLYKQYLLLDKLGEGANAIVFKAEQKSTGQIVAIKQLKINGQIHLEKEQKMVARFHRETQICAGVNHPNIVRLIDKGLNKDNHPYAVYEYVSGETLKSYIHQKGGLSAEETKVLMLQVLEALCAAHEKGIVHRDLKPQNMMVFESGTNLYVKVLDFGIGAITHQFRSFDQTQLTMTEDVLGTPIYAAPEQLRGGIPTTQSDLYAWGLITLECMTGQPVLSGNTLAEVFHQHLSLSNVPLPSSLVEHELGSLLRSVLEKSLDRRASSTKEVLDRLRSINLSTLVGEIRYVGGIDQDVATEVNYLNSSLPKVSKKNMTALAVKLRLETANSDLDLETLEMLQKDQMNSLKDLAVKYGGYLALSYANHLMIYFGYPESDDSTSRRAGKTALLIKDDIRKRDENLQINLGVSLRVKLTMHTGEVILKPKEVPEGLLFEVVLEQLAITPSNTILCSESSYNLLNQIFDLGLHETHSVKELKEDFFELKQEKDTSLVSQMLSGLIGRIEEKNRLVDKWEAFKQKKNNNALLIHGEAGAGKSSLIFDFYKGLENQQEKVVLLQGVPEGQNNALRPFFQYVLNTIRQQDQQTIGELESLRLFVEEYGEGETEIQLTILCAWLGIDFDSETKDFQVSPQKQKQLVFEFLTSLFKKINNESAYLLVVEDLHCFDPTSLELINLLLLEEQVPFFLLMSSRLDTLKDELVDKLTLGGINLETTRTLCFHLLNKKKVDENTVNYVFNKSNGIPLYIEELVFTLIQQNLLRWEEEREEFCLIPDEDLSNVPAKLSDLLHARLDQLLVAKPIAQAASVLGRAFNEVTLEQVIQVDSGILKKALNELVENKIVLWNKQDTSYVFRHALIRDAAYNSILKEERKSLHLRSAEALLNQNNGLDQIEIADHYALGENYDEAVLIGKKTAKKLLGLSLNQETINVTNKVKTWTKSSSHVSDLNLTLSVETIKINAMMAVYGWTSPLVKEAAIEAFNRIPQQGFEGIDPSVVTEVLWALNSYYNISGERDLMKDLSIQFLNVAQELNHVECTISALLCEGLYKYLDGSFEDSKHALEKAKDLIDNKDQKSRSLTTDVDSEVYILSVLAQVYWQLGEGENARQLNDYAIDVARNINQKSSLCLALLYRAAIHFFDSDREHVGEVAQELIGIAEKYGLIAYSTYGYVIYSWATNNLETIEQIIQQLEAMGLKIGLTAYKACAAEVVFEKGDTLEAIQRLESCLKLCDENKEYYFQKKLLEMKTRFNQAINNTVLSIN